MPLHASGLGMSASRRRSRRSPSRTITRVSRAGSGLDWMGLSHTVSFDCTRTQVVSSPSQSSRMRLSADFERSWRLDEQQSRKNGIQAAPGHYGQRGRRSVSIDPQDMVVTSRTVDLDVCQQRIETQQCRCPSRRGTVHDHQNAGWCAAHQIPELHRVQIGGLQGEVCRLRVAVPCRRKYLDLREDVPVQWVVCQFRPLRRTTTRSPSR